MQQKIPSRVFVVQQPRPNNQGWTPNLSPATKFGALHFIFSASDRPATQPDESILLAEDALQDFNPSRDYILWPNGVDPFGIWAVLLVLGKKNIDQIRGLNWERRLVRGERNVHEGFYTPVTFRLSRFNASFSEAPAELPLIVPSTIPAKIKKTYPRRVFNGQPGSRTQSYK